MITGSPYEILKSEPVCHATGVTLSPGDRIVAALVETPDDEPLQRIEFRAGAWDEGARPQPPLRLFGFWRTVVPEPGAKKQAQPLIAGDDLMDLFEQLGEDPESADARRLAFRYLLALILIRKRLLSYEGGTPAGKKTGTPGVMRVRPRGTPMPPEGPALIEVIDPGLDDETIGAVTEQLGQIMDLDSDQKQG
ncbi:MAG: hypothetical protein ACF8Q5_08995 [Phycisphaerales bacterium JB040]